MEALMSTRRFVDELMEVLQSTLSEMKPTEAQAVEQTIRQRWGGQKVYVDRALADQKARRLGAEIAAGKPIKQAIKDAGLSRRTGYRVLSRKWIVRE
jgi:hypothetical protein